MSDYLDKEYFAFHLNAPHLFLEDDFKESSETGVLYQKQNGVLVPVGDHMEDYIRQATGRPSINQIAQDAINLGVKTLYTTSLIYYPNT